MSTNEIELTFIRCQNCKSLMPSTSHVCGMCGHQRATDSSENKSNKNRLRQQSDYNIEDTLDSSENAVPTNRLVDENSEKLVFGKSNQDRQSEFKDNSQKFQTNPGRDQNRSESLSAKKVEPTVSFNRSRVEDEDQEEVPKRESLQFGNQHRQENKKGLSFSQNNRDEEFDDEEDDYDDESDISEHDSKVVVHDSTMERPKKKRRRKKKKNHTSTQEAMRSAFEQSGQSETSQRSEALQKNEIPQRNETSQRNENFQIGENSQRPENARRSEHVQRTDVTQREPVRDAELQKPAPSFSASRNMESAVRPSHQESLVTKQEPAPSIEQERRERAPMETNQNYNKPPEQAPQISEVRASQKVDQVDGQLVGWLVNFSTNRKGNSFELRIGRRFIGRQELRHDDLIIQDSAVSTPHALLHVDAQQVAIQDLMSETGTFVKSFGSYDFARIETTTKLKHGDILKLGNYELIVCLVPQS